jgi:hypothetical protein
VPLVCPKDDRFGCADWRLLKNCVLFEAREIDAWLTGLFENCVLALPGATGSWPRTTLAVERLPVKGRPAAPLANPARSTVVTALVTRAFRYVL